MNSKKRTAIETAASDIDRGLWELEDLLGMLYETGRVHAASQVLESDDPTMTGAVIGLEALLAIQGIREVA